MPKQSSEGHTTASAVAESLPQALPTIVMASLEPFVQLVRLVGRGFYNDVAIKNGEVKTGCVTCFDNCGLAVIVLDNLTRYAWVKEKELAKFLNIKEKDMLLLLGFLEKEKLLTREKIKRAKLKIKASTSDAQRCQNIGENEYETWSIPAGSYCCLNYAQVFNVTRNRLHSMKEALKDELACGNTVEQYIEEYICCICKRSYSALEAMHLMSSNGDTFNCEHCKAELIARSDLKGTKRERRTKFVDTSKSMKEQLRPLESQLNILKNLPVPHFGSLKQWTRNNVVEYVVASSSSDTMSPFLGQTKVEIALPDSSAKEADAESDSNIAGMKTLPTWLLRKAMAITKAEVGNHGSHEEERQIGIKSKRNDGDCGVVEFSASIRRRT